MNKFCWVPILKYARGTWYVVPRWVRAARAEQLVRDAIREAGQQAARP